MIGKPHGGAEAAMRRWARDMPLYSRQMLKIRPEEGRQKPFVFNRPQRYLHERVEQQKKNTGKVRALVLKGRQCGSSTYIGARGFHRAVFNRGMRTFILTHKGCATNNLFIIVKRYYDSLPPRMRPQTRHNNQKALVFHELDSSYGVATARSESPARSETIQFFHGSEVAFWPNAESNGVEAMAAVPDKPGTEILFETTPNGMEYFHSLWESAKTSGFERIFLPWYWMEDKYRVAVPEGFSITEDEAREKDVYGLDLEQVAWMRSWIAKAGADGRWRFDREFPLSAELAFQTSATNQLIKPEWILDAIRRPPPPPEGPPVYGVDPAGGGRDNTAIVKRTGRRMEIVEVMDTDDLMRIAGRCKVIMEKDPSAIIHIDKGGLGLGIISRLNELRIRHVAVNFGDPVRKGDYDLRSDASDGPTQMAYNVRAKMWSAMRDWFAQQSPSVPNSGPLQRDLGMPRYWYDSEGRLHLEAKKEIIKRLGRSPDLGDALALTFYKTENSGTFLL